MTDKVCSMSKTLLIMRHAKSSWDLPGQNDFMRPLNKRGRRAASFMGQFLQKQQLQPDLILSSPAQRTRETLEKLRPFLNSHSQINFLPSLYLASSSLIQAEIASVPANISTLMILGHNPGLWDLSQYICHDMAEALQLDTQSQNLQKIKFPTAALTHFDCFFKNWYDLAKNSVFLRGFYRPKHLMLQASYVTGYG